jgi:hypothetical protein
MGVWLVLGLPLMWASSFVSDLFFVPLMLLFISCGAYFLVLRCPNCRKHFGSTSMIRGKYRGEFYGRLVPKRCAHCGYRFE